MIIEDDPMVLEVNSSFLNKITMFELCGFAASGKEAIKKIKELEPDLVLLDMYLPEISGIEVLKQMREQGLPTDVIMITAARDSKSIQEVFRLGAVDYMVKPFHFKRFKSALDSYQKMRTKLKDSGTLQQEDIDEIKKMKESDEHLPKGLSEKTLQQILTGLMKQTKPVTSENLATYLGMARVTVRRYLDYLGQTGKIQVDIQYGNVGRPSHFYFIEKK
ncbi:two-component system response regulator [Bacillus sp. MRMR6]|nr:two-component system response regulator [Bacillus sp. MRMR6]